MKRPILLAGRRLIAVIGLILLSLTVAGIQFALAPPSSGGRPMPISQYGVVRIYATQTFTGNVKITIVSDSMAPFFVEKILVTVNRQADFDIILDNINIDGTGVIQVSGYSPTSRVVVVPSGFMIGEVISSLPPSLKILLSIDPLGNDAISVSGLQGNGLVVGLRYVSGAYNLGTIISATALITGPTNATIIMSMS